MLSEAQKLRKERVSKECPVLKSTQKFCTSQMGSLRGRRVKDDTRKGLKLSQFPYADLHRLELCNRWSQGWLSSVLYVEEKIFSMYLIGL